MGYLAGFAILVVALVAYELINQNIVAIVEALGLGHYLRAEAIEDGSGRLIAWKLFEANSITVFLRARDS